MENAASEQMCWSFCNKDDLVRNENASLRKTEPYVAATAATACTQNEKESHVFVGCTFFQQKQRL